MLTADTVTVLVVDDHPVVRDGVATQLAPYRDVRVVARASSGLEAEALCRSERPRVVLLDVRLPDADPADLVARLLAVSPGSRVLLFTAFPEHATVGPALAAGASGLLVKDATSTALRDAVLEVARKGTYSGRRGSPSTLISPREYDVLLLVASGNTNADIATALNLSHNTVKTYLSNVMHKLEARNRAQAISNARARGML